MTLDEKIHIVLEKLAGSKWSPLRTEIVDWVSVDDLEIKIIIHTLLKEELIVSEGEGFYITKLGRKIKDNGGWNHFIKRQNFEESRKREKDEFDFRNSAYLVRVQWWPIVISIIGLGLSIFALMTKLDKPNDQLHQNNSEAKMQVDSLRISPKDSLNKK